MCPCLILGDVVATLVVDMGMTIVYVTEGTYSMASTSAENVRALSLNADGTVFAIGADFARPGPGGFAGIAGHRLVAETCPAGVGATHFQLLHE